MRVPVGPPDLRSGKAHLSLGAALEPGQGAGPWRRLTHSRPKLPGFPAGPPAPPAQGASSCGTRPGLPWSTRSRSPGRTWHERRPPVGTARIVGAGGGAQRRGQARRRRGRLQSAGVQEPTRPRAQRWSLDFPLAGLPARSAQTEDARGLKRVCISRMEKLWALATHSLCARMTWIPALT